MRRLGILAILAVVAPNPVEGLSAQLSKVEAAAAKRFKNYDKLCKTCPTLLQPKIATLEEMIVGLSITEREELLQNVARRCEQQQEEEATSSIQTAEDVFRFQTGSDAIIEVPDNKSRNEPSSTTREKIFSKQKSMGKMDKTRAKFEESKASVAHFQRLLDETNTLLAGKAPPAKTDTTDSSIYHCIDELQKMSRAELKMQRLKYVAQKTKYGQKMAKCRVKLYEATLNN